MAAQERGVDPRDQLAAPDVGRALPRVDQPAGQHVHQPPPAGLRGALRRAQQPGRRQVRRVSARRLEARAHQAAARPLRLLGGHRARVDPPADTARRRRRIDPVRGGFLARRAGRTRRGRIGHRPVRGGRLRRAGRTRRGRIGRCLAGHQAAAGGQPGARHLRDGVHAGAVGAHDVRPGCPLRFRNIVLRGLLGGAGLRRHDLQARRRGGVPGRGGRRGERRRRATPRAAGGGVRAPLLPHVAPDGPVGVLRIALTLRHDRPPAYHALLPTESDGSRVVPLGREAGRGAGSRTAREVRLRRRSAARRRPC